MEQIKHVTVLSKTPKNSIRVATSDSGMYSSDFSYVVETDKSQTLNLIIETKDTASPDSLRAEKNCKIKHAERFFNQIEADVLSMSFSTKFQDNLMKDVIRDVFEYTTT